MHFTKDWNKFYFKSLLALARILNALGDRLELLPSVLPNVISPWSRLCGGHNSEILKQMKLVRAVRNILIKSCIHIDIDKT